jgi:hypothetical protein
MQHDALPAVAHSPVDRNLCNSELAVSLFSTRDVTLGELWLGPEARTVQDVFKHAIQRRHRELRCCHVGADAETSVPESGGFASEFKSSAEASER